MSKQSAIVGFIIVGLLAFLVGRSSMPADSAGGDSPATEAAAPAKADAPAAAAPAAKAAGAILAGPSQGGDKPLVTILEISDFQCPFCSRVLPTIKQILDTYGDKVRVVWVNQPLPFHKRAKPAAIAALAAHRQGKFWEMHDKLFANMKQLTDANFDIWAKELGLDMAKFKKDMADPVIGKKVDNDQKVANALGARGTPAFLINGKLVTGARPFAAFKTEIDAGIAAAEAELKKGTSQEALHEKLASANNPKYVDYVIKGKTPPAQPARGKADAAKKKPRPVDKTVYKVTVRDDDPAFGPKDALVTIVEFSDFECPFCSRVLPTLKEIKAKYPDTVRVLFKQNPLPFHKNARSASYASLAANEQGKFWEMHDQLFANMKSLNRDTYLKIAGEIGLDVARFTKDFDAGLKKYDKRVNEDQKLGADVMARGTPNFFINGRKLTGAQPFASFKTVIDEEIAKAQQLIKAGTPKAKVYEKIIAKGKTFEPLESEVRSFDLKNAPYDGADNAKIQLVEFSDFQCPYCWRIAPVLKEVVKMFPGQAAVYFKHFPLSFHKQAVNAAKASMAAHRQGKFWEMHDLLFQNMKALSDDIYVTFAEKLGLDMAKFKKDMADPSIDALVKQDQAEGSRAGVRGTPTFFINGRKYAAPDRSPAGIKKIIEQHILKK